MSTLKLALDYEDPTVRSRLIRVSVGSKGVITPRRSLCLTLAPNSEAKVLRANPAITGIIEMPREIDKEQLEDIDSDRDKQESFSRNIRYRFSNIDTATDITVFIYRYTNSEGGRNRQPSRTETEYLCGLLNHPYNDIWIPPIVPDLNGQSYLPYLKDFYDEAESYPRAATAALIPHVSRLEIRLLRKLYTERQLRYFVMDFAGKNPLDLALPIGEVLKLVDYVERETGNVCFLHGINVPLTRAHWSDPVVPAKDIVLYGLGFNCFGTSHVHHPLPSEIVRKLKSTTRPYRLFNRNDYGYYRNDTRDLKELLREPTPTIISAEHFTDGMKGTKIGETEKLFNVERHGLEASTIRTKLIQRENIGKYIQGKSQITEIQRRKLSELSKQQSSLQFV